MKVLVSGGAGFVGSQVVKLLLEQGSEVIVLDDLSSGRRGPVAGAKFILGDIGNHSLLNHLLGNTQVDCVIHLAALDNGLESLDKPARYLDNNLVKTIGLLDAMVRHGVMKLIFASSAAVYGEPLYTPIDESHRKAPSNPYGAAKWMVEQVLQQYERAYGLTSVSLRYFNVAGADPDGMIGSMRIPETHLLPLLLQVASGRRPYIDVYGRDYATRDGTCVRDFVHVRDVSQAHVLALRRLMAGTRCDAFNIGYGVGYTVQEMITVANRVTGRKIAVRERCRREGDAACMVADTSHARQSLGWRPEFADIETIVHHAWDWEQKRARGAVQQFA